LAALARGTFLLMLGLVMWAGATAADTLVRMLAASDVLRAKDLPSAVSLGIGLTGVAAWAVLTAGATLGTRREPEPAVKGSKDVSLLGRICCAQALLLSAAGWFPLPAPFRGYATAIVAAATAIGMLGVFLAVGHLADVVKRQRKDHARRAAVATRGLLYSYAGWLVLTLMLGPAAMGLVLLPIIFLGVLLHALTRFRQTFRRAATHATASPGVVSTAVVPPRG
jgi:hypothetical protein